MPTNKKVVWREPEAVGRKRISATRHAQALANTLKENPGRWALLSTTKNPTTVAPPFRGKDFERAYRSVVVNGQRCIRAYARYIGSK